VPIWGPGAGGEPNCNPILVEVFELDREALKDWSPPARAGYAGIHGLRVGNGSRPPLNRASAVDNPPDLA
jgi:hypothetical protein